MYVHGKTRCKFFFGCKIVAINFCKLFRILKGVRKLCNKSGVSLQGLGGKLLPDSKTALSERFSGLYEFFKVQKQFAID